MQIFVVYTEFGEYEDYICGVFDTYEAAEYFIKGHRNTDVEGSIYGIEALKVQTLGELKAIHAQGFQLWE